MPPRPTVLLAHGDRAVLLHCRLLLAGDGFRPTGEARSTASAVALARLGRPRFVVLGEDIPGDVPSAVSSLRALGATGVVVLIGEPAHPSASDLVLAGADGLVPLDRLDTLAVCLRAVLRGEPAIPRRLVGSVLEECRRRHAAHQGGTPLMAGLTLREAQIIELLRQGRVTREIAEHLGVEPGTVRSHIAGARRKLRVVSREQAVEVVSAGVR